LRNLIITSFLGLILVLGWPFFTKSISDFYFFQILSVSKTKGTILDSKQLDSWDGRAFDCRIAFSSDGKSYVFKELVPWNDKGDLRPGDSINVTSNRANPFKATANKKFYILFKFVMTVVFVFFLVGSGIQLLKTVLGVKELADHK
jgi:hypothetical protein